MSIAADNPKLVYDAAPNPTAAPSLALATLTHALGTPTWYVAVTWETSHGETMVGPETSITLEANKTPVVTPPEWVDNVVACNVYAGTASGTLYYQGQITTPFGTWQFPATGLLTATAPPASNATSTTLWLPRKFVKWECDQTRQPAITQGATYVQVASFPSVYAVKATTAIFPDDSESWRGLGAETFTAAWLAFWEGYGGQGRVFDFYRTATGAGVEGVDKFSRAVMVGKDAGLSLLIGRPRYQLAIEFRTESAAR